MSQSSNNILSFISSTSFFWIINKFFRFVYIISELKNIEIFFVTEIVSIADIAYPNMCIRKTFTLCCINNFNKVLSALINPLTHWVSTIHNQKDIDAVFWLNSLDCVCHVNLLIWIEVFFHYNPLRFW